MSPERVTRLTLAAVAIHNFLITQKDMRYMHLIRADVRTGATLPGMQHMGNRTSSNARSVQDALKAFVNGVGKVPWQENLRPSKQ